MSTFIRQALYLIVERGKMLLRYIKTSTGMILSSVASSMASRGESKLNKRTLTSGWDAVREQ